MNDSCESQQKATDRMTEVLNTKFKTRIEFWNVRTMYEVGNQQRYLSKTDDLVADEYQIKRTLLRQPFQWHPKVDDPKSNATTHTLCRNSVQGKSLIVDERGYVCTRSELVSGCCNSGSSRSHRYACSSCNEKYCCAVYEFCVSCCLKPDKQPLLRRILVQARDSLDKLFVSVSDHFELCLAKCRTSSQSVQHENSYRHPEIRYCYGENIPDLKTVGV
ncbi:hypothetical protein ScPMuIL_005446 [Solemya velum]